MAVTYGMFRLLFIVRAIDRNPPIGVRRHHLTGSAGDLSRPSWRPHVPPVRGDLVHRWLEQPVLRERPVMPMSGRLAGTPVRYRCRWRDPVDLGRSFCRLPDPGGRALGAIYRGSAAMGL